ncbi:MAG: GNAT family N-acetyltransferase [Bacilli bacterium]|nr:GNAT family N-acetyltransferase [Bacilli bacterium]MDD3896056.1 GNAT family N-acetyltransferase [Bacilli bacterium]MDD4407887.1 GNAT family N-acetyltransferase [Bacilli bacterium]
MIEYLKPLDEIKEILNLERSNIVILVKKDLNIIGLGKINLNSLDGYLLIEKSYRGNGYGKDLLYQLIDEAKKIGLEHMYISCSNDDYIIKKIVLEVKGVHISTNNNEVKYIIPLNK